MTAAVLASLSAAVSGPAGAPADRAAALVTAGAGVPEELHARLLAALRARAGWPGLRDAAGRLVAPLLPNAGPDDPAALLAAAGRTEPWLHVGHRTVAVPAGGGLAVRHLPELAGRPSRAESLFVCALHVEAAAATGARLRLRLAGPTARPELLGPGGGPLPGWCLEPVGGALRPRPAGVRERLDAVIRTEPAAGWRLAGAAARLHASPRSLQRELAAAGTSFQAELGRARLARAAQLARRTALPFGEIAAAAGFADQAHLSNRFRARLGCTPSAYRERPESAVPVAGEF
ncbi:helix-turn-helix domain-containing protein [Kitasatospora paranensis]|uniref:Helix-turn-helix domain-containing protein n=1 Tax=Kitasatospora paranensis TaxID=258053 RepID=A0ABW2G3Q5_9ACTN